MIQVGTKKLKTALGVDTRAEYRSEIVVYRRLLYLDKYGHDEKKNNLIFILDTPCD